MGGKPQTLATSSNSMPDHGQFSFSLEQLSTLHNPKNLTAFSDFGGLQGLERGLRSDRNNGLDAGETTVDGITTGVVGMVSSSPISNGNLPGFEMMEKTTRSKELGTDTPFADRKRVFLDNHLPTKKLPSYLQLLLMAYNDPVLYLLTAAAVVSLAIGLYQTFDMGHTPGNPPVEWVEGVAILVAVVVIVLVGSINDWEKSRQFQKLNKQQLERDVKIIRSGKSKLIPISDVLVGDVVHIEPGDAIPADGILINGYNVMCDESSATGESDLICKCPGDDVFHAMVDTGRAPDSSTPGLDPFVLSGTKVLDGVGSFLVTATGVNSTYGRILASLRDDSEPTPLQVRLTIVAKYIARSGGLFAILLFIALFIKFLVGLSHSSQTPAEKGQNFLQILIIALTVLVIAVPEGLPLAVTLSLAFATTRMMKDNNLVRQLKACETMGNATNICSDKTGTLTQNKMAVVCGSIGRGLRFHDRSSASSIDLDSANADTGTRTISPEVFARELAPDVKSILRRSIALNSTAFEGKDGQSFVGPNTESALLGFARDMLGMEPVRIERARETITQLIPFSGARQCMATIIELPGSEPMYRVFIKGASEVLLSKSSRIIRDPTEGCGDTEMSAQDREEVADIIKSYASQTLRTISLTYRDIPQPSLLDEEMGKAKPNFTLEYLLQDMVFLGIMGIHDPLRPGVPAAVRDCQRAGVTVRMVTGDNLRTAQAIAEQCGILSGNENDLVMEGAQFRSLSEAKMKEVIPHLKVLARSNPEDKQKLVLQLKEAGEIVAVTGDGTNDASALSAADVSFSMGGISGTEVARMASSIILMTDDFTCIVKAIMWGRAVNDSVKKFLQFQITITITSVLLTVISAISSSSEQSVLTAVQLMWVNLFQDTLAALALATDPPQPRVLDRRPESRSASLINIPMWKTIVGQSIYQLTVTLILYFAGADILSYETDVEKKQLQTLVFNTYVWMQIFNMYNNRQYDNTFNVFEGMLRNWLFMTVSSIMMGTQVLIIFVGGQAFSVVHLTGPQWAISLVLGVLSLPIGALIRWIPDGPFEEMKQIAGNCVSNIMRRLRRQRPSDAV